MTKPLIDGDILLYELGYCGEYIDEDGEKQIREWEFVRELTDLKVTEICESVFNTEEPTLYFTGHESIIRVWNNVRRDSRRDYLPNFRLGIASKKGYKAQRHNEKPFHYYNILAYLLSKHDAKLAIGIEADDLLAIDQTENTIICSRDKDLRQVGGWHYSWPCGRQAAFGPELVNNLGYLKINSNKLMGVGLKFFYAQCLMGDPVDNIPGLPKYGPVKTFNLLNNCETEVELFEVVQTCYKIVYGEEWSEHLLEQARLVWMVRSVNEDGSPVMYNFPEVV